MRRLCHALITTTLAAGGLVVAATPSHAEGDSCSTATPFTGNVASTVGPGDTRDYWTYSATFAGTYRFTLTSAQTTANLWVYDGNCSQTYCTGPQTGTVEWCEVPVTTPTTFKVRVYDTIATTPNAYTLQAEWRTQPRLGTQCSDGADNDGDGFADTADTGCAGLLDTSEADEQCPATAGVVTCVGLTSTGAELTRLTVYGPDVTSVQVVGSVDLYQFTLPGGAKANVPCVVLSGVANPCADLGGTYFARMLSLAPVNAPWVDPILAEPLTTVGICEATLTATVNSIGVESVPAVTVC